MSDETRKPFGLDHPGWREPACFFFDTAEIAWASIDRVYGTETDHMVVEYVAVPRSANE